jgi:hypothetical protein
MTIQYKSWVSETGTLTGTDPVYTLPGTTSTPSGNQFFRKVSAAFTATATVVLTLTSATGAETSVWTYTPGASGAPGTITRVTLLESSTGSTINWAGVAANISGDIPAPASASLGASSAGRVSALNTAGLIDPSMISLIGPIVTGVSYMFWPPVGAGGSHGNVYNLSHIYRQTVLWPFLTAPKYLGAYIDTVSSGGNFAVRVYESLPDSTAGALIIDTGSISTTNGGIILAAVTALLEMTPGAYVFDFLVDTNGQSAGFRGGTEFTGVVFTGGTSVCLYGQAVQMLDGYLNGSFGPAPNPCNYNSAAFAGGSGSASTASGPAFVVQF